jgi:hypothetical protein
MSTRRAVATTAAAFVVSQVLAIAIHGFILAQDYAPFVSTIVWFYSRMRLEGTWMKRGLVLGVAAWIVGQAPHWLLWYAEQPWPGSLVVKQLGLELIASIIIGLTIAAVAGDRVAVANSRGDRLAVTA